MYEDHWTSSGLGFTCPHPAGHSDCPSVPGLAIPSRSGQLASGSGPGSPGSLEPWSLCCLRTQHPFVRGLTNEASAQGSEPSDLRPHSSRELGQLAPGFRGGGFSSHVDKAQRVHFSWRWSSRFLLAGGSRQADCNPRPLLLAGYEDGSVALWDVSEQKVCSHIACHEEPVMDLDFDSQKARGISGSAGKALAVWSLDGQQALQVRGTHELTNPGIAEITIRPDRKILATAGWDHRIRVFHWRTMQPLAVLAFHSAAVQCVAFAADGLLAAGSKDQRISLWSLYPRA
ncbi:guanine nucleotide-binding protein subunit beta-like protein 1 isoform X2 [Macaca mulatta]